MQQLTAAAFGIGSAYGSAAYSRKQENEADHLGIIFAAMAGYDPLVAVDFWKRMAAATGSSYSLLSDHPSDEARIKNIKGWMQEAQSYYKKTGAAPVSSSGMRTLHISSKKK